MADFSKPVLTDLYADVLEGIRDLIDSTVQQLDGTSDTNLPVGAKRWNAGSNKWEKWGGASWSDLSALYAINVTQLNGLTEATAETANTVMRRDANGRSRVADPSGGIGEEIVNVDYLTAVVGDAVQKAGDTMTGNLTMPQANSSSPSIHFTGDVNTGIYNAGQDILGISCNGAPNLRVSHSGIYTWNGSTDRGVERGHLNIWNGNSGFIGSVFTGADDLIIENDTSGGLTILTPNTQNAYIMFADQDQDAPGSIIYSHSNDDMYFRTGGNVTRLQIGSTGESEFFGGLTADKFIADTSGSVGAPAITFNGDEDTGLYRLASNLLGIAIGGNGTAVFNTLGLTIQSANFPQLNLKSESASGTGQISFGDPSSADVGEIRYSHSSDLMSFSIGGSVRYYMLQSDLRPLGDNTKDLGISNIAWKEVHSYSFNNVSDARLKTDVTDAKLGLNFIKLLSPVSYKWDIPESVDGEGDTTPAQKGTRTHYGLLAQDVAEVVKQLGSDGDFAGWVLADKDDPESRQSLRYQEFIAPIIKAIQELSDKIDVLESYH